MSHAAGLVIACTFVSLAAGCQEHSGEESHRPTTGRGCSWAFPDDQERTLDQENPGIDGRLRGIVSVTKVQATDDEQYQRQKQAGHVAQEERHDRFIYYAIQESRDAGPAMYSLRSVTKRPLARTRGRPDGAHSGRLSRAVEPPHKPGRNRFEPISFEIDGDYLDDEEQPAPQTV